MMNPKLLTPDIIMQKLTKHTWIQRIATVLISVFILSILMVSYFQDPKYNPSKVDKWIFIIWTCSCFLVFLINVIMIIILIKMMSFFIESLQPLNQLNINIVNIKIKLTIIFLIVLLIITILLDFVGNQVQAMISKITEE